MFPVSPSECARARMVASERLDGAVPELDAVRLDAHLARCAACREFAAGVAACTAELREAPMEQPPDLVLRRGNRGVSLRVPAAAAAIAGVLLIGTSVFASLSGAGGEGSAHGSARPSLAVIERIWKAEVEMRLSTPPTPPRSGDIPVPGHPVAQ